MALLPVPANSPSQRREPGLGVRCAFTMALDVEQRLGSLAVFIRDDFEGDWRRVAGGGFGQVFQARHRRWRTQYAIKCSPCLLPEATRYLSPDLFFPRRI